MSQRDLYITPRKISAVPESGRATGFHWAGDEVVLSETTLKWFPAQ
jgi:hypothetical protein